MADLKVVDAPDNTGDVVGYMLRRREQFGRRKVLTDELGQTKADFVEASELNKTAVSFAERLDRLSPEVRADVIRSLDVISAEMRPVWDKETTPDMFPAG